MQDQEHAPPIACPPYGKWMWGLVVVPPIAAVLTVILAPDPHGHWSEHLWSAYLDGAQLVLLIALAAMVGARSLRSSRRLVPVLLLLSLGVIAAGIVYEIMGNHQVAQSIWRTRGNPEFGDGYVEGHDRAETGDLLVIVGGATFAFILGITRRVPLRIAGLALVMVIIPPPFAWPAVGVLMLLLYGLTAEAGFNTPPIRRTASTRRATPPTGLRRLVWRDGRGFPSSDIDSVS